MSEVTDGWNVHLKAMNDVLHHDILQGEKCEMWPVSEDARVEAARIVAPQEHGLEVGTTVGDGGQLLV